MLKMKNFCKLIPNSNKIFKCLRFWLTTRWESDRASDQP